MNLSLGLSCSPVRPPPASPHPPCCRFARDASDTPEKQYQSGFTPRHDDDDHIHHHHHPTCSSRHFHHLYHHAYLSIDSANFICACATTCNITYGQSKYSWFEPMHTHADTFMSEFVYIYVQMCGVPGTLPAHQQKERRIDMKACESNYAPNSYRGSVRIVTINTYQRWSRDLQAFGGEWM